MGDDGPFKPAPESPAPSAPSPDLEDQIDQLLTDVEALTNEVLAGKPPTDAGAGPAAPADDAGLAVESPLIQDGERIPVDEVVADVDLELEKVDRMVRQIGGEVDPAATEAADPDDLEVLDEELRALEARAASTATAQAASEFVPASPLLAQAPAPDAAATQAPPNELADAADEIAPEPAPTPGSVPAEEGLDADLETLFARSAAAASSAPTRTGAEAPAGAAPQPAPGERGPLAASDDPALWPLIRRKLRTRLHRGLEAPRDALTFVLDLIDRPFGRVPAPVKELIGYCALGTLAMCLAAIAVFWLLQRV